MKKVKWTSKGRNEWDFKTYVDPTTGDGPDILVAKVINRATGFHLELSRHYDTRNKENFKDEIDSLIEEIKADPRYISTERNL